VFPTLDANFPVRAESKSTGLLAIEQILTLSSPLLNSKYVTVSVSFGVVMKRV